jgi:hypothetical protein
VRSHLEEGEGTNLDLDKYDQYYHHLFLWDEIENRAGAYRMGLGSHFPKYGIEGFYFNENFSF